MISTTGGMAPEATVFLIPEKVGTEAFKEARSVILQYSRISPQKVKNRTVKNNSNVYKGIP